MSETFLNQEKSMASDEAINKAQAEIRDVIAEIQEQYQRAVAPYLERLRQLESLRPIRHTISVDQARELGLIS
jgi:hypothetical protein